jgi:hypothetical protein
VAYVLAIIGKRYASVKSDTGQLNGCEKLVYASDLAAQHRELWRECTSDCGFLVILYRQTVTGDE